MDRRAKYDAEHTTQVALKLNLKTDADILQALDQAPSKQGYIKQLIRADIEEEKKMKIQFEAGTSRHGDYGVNYLISSPIENSILYAETAVPEGASDDYGYFALKAEIIRQAAAEGIPADQLSFWYDGQDGSLAADAHADCEVEGW